MTSSENISPVVLRRVMKELMSIVQNPPDGVRLLLNEEQLTQVHGVMKGPDGTPFADGWFKFRMSFSSDFPVSPPRCYFTTKLFHPNVGKSGEICVDTLKKDWKQELGIWHILLTIKCLLIYPNAESALNEEAGRMLLDNYAVFASRARLWTSIYAANAGDWHLYDSNGENNNKVKSLGTKRPASIIVQKTIAMDPLPTAQKKAISTEAVVVTAAAAAAAVKSKQPASPCKSPICGEAPGSQTLFRETDDAKTDSTTTCNVTLCPLINHVNGNPASRSTRMKQKSSIAATAAVPILSPPPPPPPPPSFEPVAIPLTTSFNTNNNANTSHSLAASKPQIHPPPPPPVTVLKKRVIVEKKHDRMIDKKRNLKRL